MEELNKVEEYAQGEYVQKVNSGVDLFESDSPAYKIQTIEVQTKRKLIGLIRKYFNKEVFQYNKPYIKDFDVFKEEAVETPHEMLVALNVNKNRIYSLLSILGYYQRHFSYFLSKADFLNLCYDYSNQVYLMNKSLGMEYRFVNIFIGSCRIKPSRVKKVEDTDEEIDLEAEKYQSDKFIDIDKISLTMLIYPYLKNNTKEIHKIIEIMTRNFKKYKKDSSLGWEKTMEEVLQIEKTLDIVDDSIRHEIAWFTWINEKIHEMGGITIYAHPFWVNRDSYVVRNSVINEVLKRKLFDAIEILGGNARKYNLQQA